MGYLNKCFGPSVVVEHRVARRPGWLSLAQVDVVQNFSGAKKYFAPIVILEFITLVLPATSNQSLKKYIFKF